MIYAYPRKSKRHQDKGINVLGHNRSGKKGKFPGSFLGHSYSFAFDWKQTKLAKDDGRFYLARMMTQGSHYLFLWAC